MFSSFQSSLHELHEQNDTKRKNKFEFGSYHKYFPRLFLYFKNNHFPSLSMQTTSQFENDTQVKHIVDTIEKSIEDSVNDLMSCYSEYMSGNYPLSDNVLSKNILFY